MIDSHNNELHYLVERYVNNSISKEELERLLFLVDNGHDAGYLTDELKKYWENSKSHPLQTNINWEQKFSSMMEDAKRFTHVPAVTKYKIGKWYGVAAAVIIVALCTSAFFLFFNKETQNNVGVQTISKRYKNDLLPGTNGAILTLANGKQIVLDSAGNGLLAVQGQSKVVNKNGEIVYKGENDASGPNEILYNTMTTPKGRQYQLVLADGSKVWLNAASSIRFPATFSNNERRVEITGEAYFEIAAAYSSNTNNKIPFIVSANGTDIKVLGTHFNVNAYNDESAIRTTLLEGSVNVSSANSRQSITIKPGQQSQVTKAGNIKVMDDVDVDAVMAWKNGYFSFQQADLTTVMRQVSRWYDVDIVYEGTIPNRRFGGEITRNTNASQVLQILEDSKIHFRIEGKKIVVMPE
jgi:ferric-dicitrate binding protein FerR (iron transport regulator)